MHFARSNNLQRETSLHTTSSPLLFFKRKEQIEDDAFACSVFLMNFVWAATTWSCAFFKSFFPSPTEIIASGESKYRAVLSEISKLAQSIALPTHPTYESSDMHLLCYSHFLPEPGKSLLVFGLAFSPPSPLMLSMENKNLSHNR